MADHIKITLPFVLILIAFLLKLFMDRNATLPLVIRSLFELPVNIVFLALSFTTAFTISDPANLSSGMCALYILFATALINVVLWRRSITLYERSIYFWSSTLFVANSTIAGFVLYKSVGLLSS